MFVTLVRHIYPEQRSFLLLDFPEIDAQVSLNIAECCALEKKKKKRENSYILVRKSLVYEECVSVGIQMYKMRVIYARAADLFVYGHSLTHSYMPDDIVGRALSCTNHKK